MKAVIVSPYFNTLGGGERYILTLAEALLKKNWFVDVTLENQDTINEAEKRFNLQLKNIAAIPFSKFTEGNVISKFAVQRKYDLIFWVSNGSIPLMFGKKNLLHFQVPFHNVNGGSLQNKFKLKRIDKIICNSNFTKNFIDKEYGVKGDIWYPPVSVDDFSSGKKENIILAVGRFEKSLTEKRQDILVETYKLMVKNGLKGWRLILTGGCTGEESQNEILNDLKKKSAGFSIEIKVNVSFLQLKDLYAKAKIFWHAAGYEADEEKNPQKVEHFGMTTVEAMAAGCVPVVINKGGQKEIIENNKNGFLWDTTNDLMNLTAKVIKEDNFLGNISKEAVRKSRDFSKEKFYEKVYSFVKQG